MLETLFTNPVNLVLLVPLLYFVYLTLNPQVPPSGKTRPTTYQGDGYDWMPPSHPECTLLRSYTPKELSVFDGKTPSPDGKPGKILLAIERRERVKGEDGQWTFERKERTVFDVSAGRSFYGPDGPYGNFAGRDASRGMAMQSFEEEMLTSLDKPLDPLENMSKSEIDNMQSWHGHFSTKYIICGELVEDPEFTKE